MPFPQRHAIVTIFLLSLFPSMAFAESALYPIKKGEKYGYINSAGDIVVPPKYDSAWSFVDGVGVVTLDGVGTGFINAAGEEFIKCRFASCGYFSESGLASVSVEIDPKQEIFKYGFIDKTGAWVIRPRFDYTHGFHNELAAVMIADKWGYVNRSGTLVIKPKFEVARSFQQDVAPVRQKGKWGYIRKNGDYLIPPTFKEASVCRGGKLRVRDADSSWLLIDKDTLKSIPLPYDWVSFLSDGRYVVSKDRMCGAIDTSGEIVIPLKYNQLGDFHEGLAWFKRENGGKIGFIDPQGKVVISARYSGVADSFLNGVAEVILTKSEKEETHAYITKSGKVIWKWSD